MLRGPVVLVNKAPTPASRFPSPSVLIIESDNSAIVPLLSGIVIVRLAVRELALRLDLPILNALRVVPNMSLNHAIIMQV